MISRAGGVSEGRRGMRTFSLYHTDYCVRKSQPEYRFIPTTSSSLLPSHLVIYLTRFWHVVRQSTFFLPLTPHTPLTLFLSLQTISTFSTLSSTYSSFPPPLHEYHSLSYTSSSVFFSTFSRSVQPSYIGFSAFSLTFLNYRLFLHNLQ